MSDLVENPKDRFSHDVIHIMSIIASISEGQAPALQFIPKRVNVAVKQEATIMSGNLICIKGFYY